MQQWIIPQTGSRQKGSGVTEDTYRIRKDDLTWRVLNGEVVVLDLRTSVYLSVNNTGKALWDLLVEGADEERLVRTLIDQFGIAEETARGDVVAFLSLCSDRDLLTRGDESG
jgi:hypothetical protein